MNGFDVAARLKGDPRTSGLPILVVTKDELSGGDRVRLKGKIHALIERGELSGSRLVNVIQELVNEQQVVR
jgi:CheY-like chemotaxis protein